MTLKGSCHCGATQFEVTEAPASVTSCNCSYCSKRGALWAYYTPDQFTLTTARDRVSTYQWGGYFGQHHFCGICGCTTYGESPSWVDYKPDYANPKIGVNARLFNDFDLATVPVEHVDGKNEW
ncbi:GFA family protein [Phenylobacterium sp.]|uniref:GFA family protein n=1 Tax=Phenylobacterium sp. TaxID=1871053 RepID=UPI002731478A|nr:GFA family protein [Phenylobacterium sp.]MDP1600601.1 GFA family protein [Phenylobacterium sp.]MDP3591565.1 GFA family protein [Phenylobacterium sp.]